MKDYNVNEFPLMTLCREAKLDYSTPPNPHAATVY